MCEKRFVLKATVKTANPEDICRLLRQLIGEDAFLMTGGDIVVSTSMRGRSAKELNGVLLAALRRVEEKTTLMAEWTYGGSIEEYLDFVLNGMGKG